MPVPGGPYLTAAFFCDRVLQERDGVLTFVRVVDRWNIVGPSQNMNPTAVQTTLVIMFRSGIVRGSARITVTPVTPAGERMEPFGAPVLFEGDDDRGVGSVFPLSFPVTEPGVYWFEVGLSVQGGESEIKTHVPMRVVYLQTGPATPLGQPPQIQAP
jgi:hypothetical protein